jgi:transposase-like protein
VVVTFAILKLYIFRPQTFSVFIIQKFWRLLCKKKKPVEIIVNEDFVYVQVNVPCKVKIRNTKSNIKILIILLRLLMSLKDKNLLTFKAIATFFDYKDRRNVNNFYRIFRHCGEDFLSYLERRIKLKDYFVIIEKQILLKPYLAFSEHFREFISNNPMIKISEATFRNYVDRIDGGKIIRRIQKLTTQKKISWNIKFLLQELLQSPLKSIKNNKQIIDALPELEEKPEKSEKEYSKNMREKFLFIAYLVGNGVNFQLLSEMFGVCKATIHNWLYKNYNLDEMILNSIQKWSGKISVDEKWIRINGVWWYVLTAVDFVTGFPLFIKILPAIDGDAWTLFFKEFKFIYGIPSFIVSDGSIALAKGRKIIFAKVHFQLCKFHKLKNLYKIIYKAAIDFTERSFAFKQAEKIFNDKWISSRKRAAKKLVEKSLPGISNYVETRILAYWRPLCKSVTSNASERFNRKINKIYKGVYGFQTVESAKQIIFSLWLKEAIRNEKRHLDKNSLLFKMNISEICQQNLKLSKTVHFNGAKVANKAHKNVVGF